jgi:hypothetical protein
LLAVELERCPHFAVDSVKHIRIAEGPEHPEAGKDDFVAERLRSERESGPRNGEFSRLMVEIVPP